MRIIGILATLVVLAACLWAKVNYLDVQTQIAGDTDQGSQVAELESDSNQGGFSPSAIIDSVMSWFSSSGDGSTANPYVGNESRVTAEGNYETNQFVDEPSN